MDPLEKLNLKLDSSLRLARALTERGHECWVTTVHDLALDHSQKQTYMPYCRAKKLISSDLDNIRFGEHSKLGLEGFNFIYMRTDPPYDIRYVSSTWILSRAEELGVKVMNSPSVLRDLNEKLAIFEYPDYCDQGLVTSDKEEVYKFIIDRCDGVGIIKPLTLFGGRGVEKLDLGDLEKNLALEQIKGFTEGQLRLVQPFNSKIYEGEVRVFSCCGEPVSWCIKKPAQGEYLANTSRGAVLEEYVPSAEERLMIETVSQDLMKRGVYLAGYDVIGGQISEINITSPRLLLAPDQDTRPFYDKLVNLIERI